MDNSDSSMNMSLSREPEFHKGRSNQQPLREERISMMVHRPEFA